MSPHLSLLVYSRQLAALVLMLSSLNCSQDDENALLQQALAMSMDDPVASVVTRDTDMSEAATEDEDLALGNHLHLFYHHLVYVGLYGVLRLQN